MVFVIKSTQKATFAKISLFCRKRPVKYTANPPDKSVDLCLQNCLLLFIRLVMNSASLQTRRNRWVAQTVVHREPTGGARHSFNLSVVDKPCSKMYTHTCKTLPVFVFVLLDTKWKPSSSSCQLLIINTHTHTQTMRCSSLITIVCWELLLLLLLSACLTSISACFWMATITRICRLVFGRFLVFAQLQVFKLGWRTKKGWPSTKSNQWTRWGLNENFVLLVVK